MIEIDLLPEELKKAKVLAKRLPARKFIIPKRQLKSLAIGVFGSLVFIYLVAALGASLQKNSLERLMAEWGQLKPQQEKLDAIRNEYKILDMKNSFINQMMERRFLWSAKLNSLSDSIVVGVWLTGISIEERIKQPSRLVADQTEGRPVAETHSAISEEIFVIRGCAASLAQEATAIIGKFMQSLQENQDFSSDFEKIELDSISGRKIKDVEVKDFILTCPFKKEKI